MTRDEIEDLLDRIAAGEPEATQAMFRLLVEQDPATQILFLEAIQDAEDDNLREQLILTLADSQPGRPFLRGSAAASPGTADSSQEWQPEAQTEIQQAQGSVPVGTEGTGAVTAASAELLHALASPQIGLRIQAAVALGQAREKAAVEPLVRLLSDENRRVAGAAERALEQIGPAGVPALVQALSRGSEQARWHAAKALTVIRDLRAIPAQVEALNDPNYGVRWLAAEGLVAEGPAALAPLLEALHSRKPTAWLRQGATHVLNKVAVPNPLLRERLRGAAEQIRRGPAADIPVLARALLQELSTHKIS